MSGVWTTAQMRGEALPRVWFNTTAIHISPCNLCGGANDSGVMVVCVCWCCRRVVHGAHHDATRAASAILVVGGLLLSSVGRSWCPTAPRQRVRERVVCGPPGRYGPPSVCLYDGAGGDVLVCRGVDHSTDARRGPTRVWSNTAIHIPVQRVCGGFNHSSFLWCRLRVVHGAHHDGGSRASVMVGVC